MVFRVAGYVPGGGGGGSLGYYGLFISTTNQSSGGATAANLVAFDNTPVRANGISHSAGIFTFANAGKYQVNMQLAFTASTGANPVVSLWLAQNGTNIPNTSADFQLLGGAGTVQLESSIWIVDIAAGDTFNVYWASTNTNTSLAYQAALTNPTRPASPSATLSINQV
jgi:hypothetical protein